MDEIEEDQKRQVSEALESYEGDITPVEDEPEKEEGKAEEPEQEETPEAPSSEEPEKEEPKEEDDISQIREELTQTREELERLREERASEEEETEEPEPQEPINFLTEEEVTEAYDDPAKLTELFNDKLNQVYQMGRETALREVPSVVTDSVNRTMTVNEKAKEFYQNNPELLEHRQYVSFIANKLSSQYDDVDKLFEETAKQARKELGLKERAKNREREREDEEARKKPAFAQKPGASQRQEPGEKPNNQQKQIGDMIDALGSSAVK